MDFQWFSYGQLRGANSSRSSNHLFENRVRHAARVQWHTASSPLSWLPGGLLVIEPQTIGKPMENLWKLVIQWYFMGFILL